MLTSRPAAAPVSQPAAAFHQAQRRLVEASLLRRPVRRAARWDDRLQVAYADRAAA